MQNMRARVSLWLLNQPVSAETPGGGLSERAVMVCQCPILVQTIVGPILVAGFLAGQRSRSSKDTVHLSSTTDQGATLRSET